MSKARAIAVLHSLAYQALAEVCALSPEPVSVSIGCEGWTATVSAVPGDCPIQPVDRHGPAVSKVALALAILSERPHLTNEEIARQAGCHPSNLSRNPRFKAAREAVRRLGAEAARRSDRHRGHDMDKYEDGES